MTAADEENGGDPTGSGTGGGKTGGGTGKARTAGGASSTPYDDVFRTMMAKGGKWRIVLLNRLFPRDAPLPLDAEVTEDAAELFLDRPGGEQDEVIADSILHVAGRAFHVECQSMADGTMQVRMTEYDVAIAARALRRATSTGGDAVLSLPRSAVIWLRGGASMPDVATVVILDEETGGELRHPVHVLRLADHTAATLLDEGLVCLVPFALFTMERQIEKAGRSGDRKALDEVASTLAAILDRLGTMARTGELDINDYLLITDMLRKVTDALTARYDTVRKEMDDIMGGRILTYPGEDIWNKGLAQGREEGLEEGREEGELTGMVRVYAQTLGYSPEQIAQILNQPVDAITAIMERL